MGISSEGEETPDQEAGEQQALKRDAAWLALRDPAGAAQLSHPRGPFVGRVMTPQPMQGHQHRLTPLTGLQGPSRFRSPSPFPHIPSQTLGSFRPLLPLAAACL